MKQKKISSNSVSDRIPPLSSKYPWFVVQNLEDGIVDQIFYTIHKPLYHYQCQIPELLGKRIRACFHGWVILSNHPHDDIWSLWDPLTSKLICLPPLENFHECCLSAPPDDPNSFFLLISMENPIIAFCRLDCKRKSLIWTKMDYAKQLRSIIDEDGFLHCLTCYDGKVCALHTGVECDFLVLQVDIIVKENEVVIKLLPFVEVPYSSFIMCPITRPPTVYAIEGGHLDLTGTHFLKGSGTELFYVEINFEDETRKKVSDVFLFKLDVSSLIWEEMEDLKDAIFFIELANDYSVFYTSEIASELGGNIHILDSMGKVLYTHRVKDRTISLSFMSSLVQTSQVSSCSMLELRLEDDNGEAKCLSDSYQEEDKDTKMVVRSVKDDEVEFNYGTDESHLLNISFHVLEMIMEFCVGVEYLNFRATCKRCYLAAPLIQWSNKITLKKLQNYSLFSPWLMVLDKHRITFTDPMFGDKYYIKTPQELTANVRIYCSRFGWLLMFKSGGNMMFYNPFTTDIRELTRLPYLESCTFSAPPTSPDCVIVGFISSREWRVYIHFLAREPQGRILRLNFGNDASHSLSLPTYHGGYLYALCHDGELYAYKNLGEGNYCWEPVVTETPRSSGETLRFFQVKCDQHLLLVVVGKLGESLEVFRLQDSTGKWEKIYDIGKHMIYISDTTCLCIEARMPYMENKIYFPRLHYDNGDIIFYSLETCNYHTFRGKNLEESLPDFFGTTHHRYPHTWIEPSWC